MASRRRTWRRRRAWLRDHWRQVALLAAGVGIAVALCATALIRQSTLAEDDTSDVAPIAVHTPGPDDDTVVVVIGDSFTGGSEMNTDPTWLEQLQAEHPDWIVVDDGVGGSGYLSEPTFTHRLNDSLGNYEADLLIVAGGRNDDSFVPADVVNAADEFLTKAHRISPTTDVLMLSPWASGDPSSEILALDDGFEALAKKHDAAYFDVTRVLAPSDIGEDGIHPSDDGHAKMLTAINDELAELGWPNADAYSRP